MDDAMIETHLENLDRSLARVEQILPTLATKAQLRAAIAEAIAPLATKAELRAAIAEAIAPLATRAELRTAIAEAVAPLATKDEIRELRRHMDVLSESQRGDIRLLAEHLSVVMSRLPDR